jgi:chemotaxis protein MotB
MPIIQPHDSAPPRSRIHRTEHVRQHGSWKIAYADFVTALMCLFIVLWLMNSAKPVKDSITGYFHDPRGYTPKAGAGLANSGEALRTLKDIRERLEEAMRQAPELEKVRKNVAFSVTGEGLRIDLMENEQGTFFMAGSSEPSKDGELILRVLAGEIGKLPNQIVLEGHSDAKPFRNAAPQSGYGNWELSADRANAARRSLHSYGVPGGQVVEVRGFADQRLAYPDAPEDPRNRRISIVVKFL